MKLPKIMIDGFDTKTLEIVKNGHQVNFVQRGDSIICNDLAACDYYKTGFDENGDEFDAGAWIHPKLEAWAKKQGGYWEWENCEAIIFVK